MQIHKVVSGRISFALGVVINSLPGVTPCGPSKVIKNSESHVEGTETMLSLTVACNYRNRSFERARRSVAVEVMVLLLAQRTEILGPVVFGLVPS